MWQGNGLQQLFKARSQILHAQIDSKTKTGAACAPRGHYMILRMQAQTAARFEHILAHVTLTGAGSRDHSRLLPICTQYGTRCPDQSMGPGGLANPETGGRAPAGAPPITSRPLPAVREDGGVVWSSDGAPFAHTPCSIFLPEVREFITRHTAYNKHDTGWAKGAPSEDHTTPPSSPYVPTVLIVFFEETLFVCFSMGIYFR